MAAGVVVPARNCELRLHNNIFAFQKDYQGITNGVVSRCPAGWYFAGQGMVTENIEIALAYCTGMGR
jgi:hypothetical protein